MGKKSPWSRENNTRLSDENIEAQLERASLTDPGITAAMLTQQTLVERSLGGQDGEGCARPGLLTQCKRGRQSDGLPHLRRRGEFLQKLDNAGGKKAGSTASNFQVCAAAD